MATELAMSDFTSGFWSLFVMVVTIVSIAGCGLLLVAMSKRRAKPTAASAAGSGTKAIETTGHVWDGDLAEYNNPLPKWWLNLFWITLVFAVLYLLLYPGFGNFSGLLGWTSAEAYAKERSAFDAQTQTLFAKYQQVDVKTLAADPEARALGDRPRQGGGRRLVLRRAGDAARSRARRRAHAPPRAPDVEVRAVRRRW